MLTVPEIQMTPASELDIALDFADLGIISAAAWGGLSPLTEISSTFDDTSATIRLGAASGVAGTLYRPTVTLTHAGGTWVQPIHVTVLARIVVAELQLAAGTVITIGPIAWSEIIGDDPIASRVWSVSGSVTGASTSATIAITVAAGLGYATEHIVTASGQEDERSYWVMGV